MAWLRIDDDFDHHPKVLELATDQRRYTWIRILIYTCRYRSPLIPPTIKDSVPKATAQFLLECVDIGLIDVTEDGYEVHDWADYQAGDPKKAARQRRWRHHDVDAPVDAYVDGDVDANGDASRVGARARPVPSPTPTTKTTHPPTPTRGQVGGRENEIDKLKITRADILVATRSAEDNP